jgi:predicted Zn-dependent peptidase
VIAGEVSTDDAIKLVKKAFDGFQRRSVQISLPVEPAPESPRIGYFASMTDQSYVVFGYRGPSASDFRDVCALDVLLTIMGDTYRGRVSSALIANKIQFSKITTDFVIQRYPSTFSVQVAVNPVDADRVAPILQSEFERLTREPVSFDELSQAKRVAEGSDLYEQETFAGQARALGLYQSIASYDLALKYGSTVHGISAGDLISVAQKYFADNNYCLARINPPKND